MGIIDSVWQISIISLFAGVLIGALGYRLLSPSVKRIDEVESERDKAREEMANYKASVNQHFNKTSSLVNDLTQNYVKVYQHLADGAQSLGDIGTLNNLLEQGQGKVSIEVSGENPVAAVSPIETAVIFESPHPEEDADDLSSDLKIDEIAPKDFVDETTVIDRFKPVDDVNNPTESNEPVFDENSIEIDSDSTSTEPTEKQDGQNAGVGNPRHRR
jgi:uncharacterized membrane-anchored protein YhcB (DUF1043 family)